MTGENKKPNWIFYSGWVVLSAICIPIAALIAWGLISQIVRFVGGTIQVAGHSRVTEDLLLFYVFLPVLGLLTGFVQYIILRRYLPRMGWWIAATVLGWLFLLVVGTPFIFISAKLSHALASVLAGGSIGFSQWLVLRHHLGRSGWWILASVLG